MTIFSYAKYKIFKKGWGYSNPNNKDYLIGVYDVQKSDMIELKQWLRCQNRILERHYKQKDYYYLVKEIK